MGCGGSKLESGPGQTGQDARTAAFVQIRVEDTEQGEQAEQGEQEEQGEQTAQPNTIHTETASVPIALNGNQNGSKNIGISSEQNVIEPSEERYEKKHPDDPEMDKVTIKIQSKFRGDKARKEVQAMKTELSTAAAAEAENRTEEPTFDINLEDPEVDKVAIMMQAKFRGDKVRKDVKVMKKKSIPESIEENGASPEDENAVEPEPQPVIEKLVVTKIEVMTNGNGIPSVNDKEETKSIKVKDNIVIVQELETNKENNKLDFTIEMAEATEEAEVFESEQDKGQEAVEEKIEHEQVVEHAVDTMGETEDCIAQQVVDPS